MAANIKIDSIICYDQQEEGRYADGRLQKDEIYFFLEDSDVPSNYVVSNVMEFLSADPFDRYHEVHPSEQLLNINGTPVITLWEYDASSSPEKLGEAWVSGAAGSSYVDLYSAKYESWYEVDYTTW